MHRDISKKLLSKALEILQSGGLVAIPTETVYGLAADASNPTAVEKIFKAKNRPENHPLIIHIGDLKQLNHWAREIPGYAFKLAESFWPGAVTLILKKQPNVLDLVTGNQDTVGIRVPNHPIARKILEKFNNGLAAPSANSFGRISPTLAEHVHEDLGNKVDLILDGGICSIGIESTIIDCTGDSPKILRPGMISELEISQALNLDLKQTQKLPHSYYTPTPTPRVSGDLNSHYAPKTKTVLINPENLNTYCENLNLSNVNYVVLSRHQPKINKLKIYDARIPTSFNKADLNHLKNWILMPEDAQAYAHCLYEQLHFSDNLNSEKIIIEAVPSTIQWLGIADRLKKASA